MRKIKCDSSHFKDGLICFAYKVKGGSHPHLILQSSVFPSKLRGPFHVLFSLTNKDSAEFVHILYLEVFGVPQSLAGDGQIRSPPLSNQEMSSLSAVSASFPAMQSALFA